MSTESEILRHHAVLAMVKKKYYSDSILHILRQLEGKKVCYISLNKTADYLKSALESNKVSASNIFFVDGVSMGIGKAKPAENVFFVSSPSALNEVGIAVEEALKKKVFDALVLDSLSTLNMYNLGRRADTFVSDIIGKIKSENGKGIFIALEDDRDADIVKSCCVDKVAGFNELYKAVDRGNLSVAITAVAILVLLALPFISILGAGMPTGMGLLEVSPSNPLIFLAVMAIVGLASFFAYRSVVIKSVDPSVLKTITSVSISPAVVRREFKAKLGAWISRVV